MGQGQLGRRSSHKHGRAMYNASGVSGSRLLSHPCFCAVRRRPPAMTKQPRHVCAGLYCPPRENPPRHAVPLRCACCPCGRLHCPALLRSPAYTPAPTHAPETHTLSQPISPTRPPRPQHTPNNPAHLPHAWPPLLQQVRDNMVRALLFFAAVISGAGIAISLFVADEDTKALVA